jgi:hypothetical protein
MVSAKYSKVTEAAANRFLSAYHLTLEQLTAVQQKQVVIYLRARKWWPWLVLVFMIGMIVFGFCALGEYLKIQKFIGEVVIISASGTEIDWQKVSGFSLEQGFIVGANALTAIYMVMFSILVSLGIRNQKRLLDAFLPSITSKPVDESDKQG